MDLSPLISSRNDGFRHLSTPNTIAQNYFRSLTNAACSASSLTSLRYYGHVEVDIDHSQQRVWTEGYGTKCLPQFLVLNDEGSTLEELSSSLSIELTELKKNMIDHYVGTIKKEK